MSTVCITTFSKDGYDLYGHRMIESWLEFWPKDYNLTIYHENFTVVETDDRIKKINLLDECPNLISFKKESESLLNNATNKKEKNRILKTVKWCHKVYAMAHALQNFKSDYVIFLDGDTYSVDIIEENFSQLLVNDNLFAVHFEKLKDGLHFETGLVVFNLNHEKTQWLSRVLTSAYDSLDIYKMKKTWDGYWFAHLYELYRLPVKNLSENRLGVFNHPLVKKSLRHNVGIEKYQKAGYNEFTGRKI